MKNIKKDEEFYVNFPFIFRSSNEIIFQPRIDDISISLGNKKEYSFGFTDPLNKISSVEIEKNDDFKGFKVTGNSGDKKWLGKLEIDSTGPEYQDVKRALLEIKYQLSDDANTEVTNREYTAFACFTEDWLECIKAATQINSVLTIGENAIKGINSLRLYQSEYVLENEDLVLNIKLNDGTSKKYEIPVLFTLSRESAETNADNSTRDDCSVKDGNGNCINSNVQNNEVNIGFKEYVRDDSLDGKLLEDQLAANYEVPASGPLSKIACAVKGNCRELKDIIELGIALGAYVFEIIGILAFLVFIYGGFLMTASFGNSEKFDQGKNALVAAVIGLIISFSAYLLIQALLKAFQVGGYFTG
jgi:hypothetical protein